MEEFYLKLIAALDKAKSKLQIKADIKSLGDFKIPLIGKLNKTQTKSQINQGLAGMTGTVKVNTKVNTANVKQQVRQATNQAQNSVKPIQLTFTLKKDKLINDIKILGQQNSKLFGNQDISSKYHKLLSSAQAAQSLDDVKNLRLQLSALRSELKANNLAGLTLGDTLKQTFKRAAELFGSIGTVMLLTQQLKNAWDTAMDLDKSFTDLVKVQDELSRSDYPDYLSRCNKKAQELATTQKALIDSATEFSKSGYSLTDSNALSEKATILSNVGDMEPDDSAKAIISGIQAYKEIGGYTDAIGKATALIDKYNEIGNTASITSAELAEGVERVGAVFADSNTDVDQFIALLAAGNRQFQNADSLSLALRTAALRIRSATVDLSAAGEDVDGVMSVLDNEKKIKALTGVEILEDDGKTIRSIYDIFLDISKVYQSMNDTDRGALLNLIAGKNRASGISSILNNMGEAAEIYENSINSAGSAQREYDQYLASSEASLNKFKASLTETYQSILTGDTTKGILDAGNAAVTFANNMGLVESTLKGLIGVGAIKAITMLSTAFKTSALQASAFGKSLTTVKNMNSMIKGTQQYTNALNALKSTAGSLSTTQLKQVLSSKALSETDRIAILRATGLSKAQAQAKLTSMGLTQATNAQNTANQAASASTFNLSAAVKGFGATVQSVLASNAVGIAIMALSYVIGAVTTQISDYKQKVQDTRQANIDAATAVGEEANSLTDIYQKYQKLNGIQERTSDQEEEYQTVIKDITSALGDKADALDGLKVGTEDYTKALQEATKAELESQYVTAKVGAQSAKDDLADAVWSNKSGSKVTIQLNEQMKGVEEHVAALEKVRGILSKYEDMGRFGLEWEPINFDEDKKNAEAIVEYYEDLVKAREEIAKDDNADFLMGSDIYEAINTTINSLTESVDNYTKSQYEALKLNYMWQNGVPTTTEEFQTMQQAILDTSGAGEYFQGILKDYLAKDFPSFVGGLNDVDKAISTTKELLADFDGSSLGERMAYINDQFEAGELTVREYFDALRTEIENTDFSEFANEAAASQQLFTDSLQKTAQGLSDVIFKFSSDKSTVTEYLEGYISIAETISALTDDLQENSAEWNKNGQAIADSTNTALDGAQSGLSGAIDNIKQYQDSIYSLEQIMNGAVEAGTDEFTAHTQVIAEDLAHIVSTGGAMASPIQQYLGSTSAEIAASLTDDVANQSVAAQAIAANTNSAIADMATNIGQIFDTLGNAIKNFNVDIKFGIKDFSWKKVDMGILGEHSLPDITFNLSASGDSLSAIGDAISSFGKSVASDLTPQMIELPDFKRTDDEYKPNTNLLDNYNKKLDDLKDKTNKANNALKEQKKALENQKKALEKSKEALEDQKQEYEDLYDAISWFYDKEIDKIDEKIDKLNDANDALKEQLDTYDSILSVISEVYQKEIDAIQAKIDALDDSNDAKSKELALEEAKRKLEEARNRKTILQYSADKGYHFVQNDKEIKEREQDVDTANADKIKAELQEQIDLLEKMKDKWAEIPDAFEKAMNRIKAAEKFGPDFEKFIIGSGDLDIEAFQKEYTNNQQQQQDNENQISEYEKEKKRIEDLKDLWEDAKNAYRDSQYEMKLASFFGSDYDYQLLQNSAGWRHKFADEYGQICEQIKEYERQIKEIQSQIDALETSSQSASSNAAKAVEGVGGAVNKVKKTAAEGGSIGKYIWDDATDGFALESAQKRLEYLNKIVGTDTTGAAYEAQQKLQNFVNEFGKLAESKVVTEDFARSLEGLRDSENGYLSGIQPVLSGVSYRLSEADKFTNGMAYYTSYAAKSLSDLSISIQKSATDVVPVIGNADNTASSTAEKVGSAKNELLGLGTAMENVKNGTTSLHAAANDMVGQATAQLEGTHQTAQVVANDMNMVKSAMDGVTEGKAEVEQTGDEVVSDTDVTLTGVIDKVSALNEQLSSVQLNKDALQQTVDAEVTDAEGVVIDTQAKLEEINTLLTSLQQAVQMLEISLGELHQAMSELDSATLSNVVATIGFGEEEGSLHGAVVAVVNQIAGEEGLLGQLSILDSTSLENIIAQFNGDESLLTSITDVMTAIYTDGDDNCLIAKINKISTTISQIDIVKDGFSQLKGQVDDCASSVQTLQDKIEGLHDKTITITTVYKTVGGHAGAGTAFGTGSATTGQSFANGSGRFGVPHDMKRVMVAELGPEMIVSSDGTYKLIKEPQRIDLRKNDVVFNHLQTEAILKRGDNATVHKLKKDSDAVMNRGLQPLDGFSFLEGTGAVFDKELLLKSVADMQLNPNKVYQDFAQEAMKGFEQTIKQDTSQITNNNQQTNTTYVISGDLSFPNITSGDDAKKLIDSIKRLPLDAKQYSMRRK